MDFALLASGSKGNAFVIKSAKATIMIDCGSTKKHILESLDKINIEIDEIDALLITHEHSDHISQIGLFGDKDIYAPISLDKVKVKKVEPYKGFKIKDISVTPIALSHDASFTVGYIIESAKEKLSYVTDTGYLSERNEELIKDSNYYVLESNHDVEMLMKTKRPLYIKSRIYSDRGHLCNESAGEILDNVISKKTKMIILAHLSEEANTREKALEVVSDKLKEKSGISLYVASAGQYEMVRKGIIDEEVDLGSISTIVSVE